MFLRPQTGTSEAKGSTGCWVRIASGSLLPRDACNGIEQGLLGSPSHRENIFALKELTIVERERERGESLVLMGQGHFTMWEPMPSVSFLRSHS